MQRVSVARPKPKHQAIRENGGHDLKMGKLFGDSLLQKIVQSQARIPKSLDRFRTGSDNTVSRERFGTIDGLAK